MPPEDARTLMEEHERDIYAHAPILLQLHDEISELQKLGFMIRGGVVTLAVLGGGGVLALILHNTGVFH